MTHRRISSIRSYQIGSNTIQSDVCTALSDSRYHGSANSKLWASKYCQRKCNRRWSLTPPACSPSSAVGFMYNFPRKLLRTVLCSEGAANRALWDLLLTFLFFFFLPFSSSEAKTHNQLHQSPKNKNGHAIQATIFHNSLRKIRKRNLPKMTCRRLKSKNEIRIGKRMG